MYGPLGMIGYIRGMEGVLAHVQGPCAYVTQEVWGLGASFSCRFRV